MMPMGFEFGFRKKLDVVKTKPKDWEKTAIDLTDFVKRVNRLKTGHPIFAEDAPTEILRDSNPNVFLMWKASSVTREEALLILNKDIHGRQVFYSDNLQKFVQAGAPLADLSPENRMEYIPAPFSYDLQPGQGIVLVTLRDAVQED
jgi:starch synthase (maltosyl-transferring)